MSNNLIMQQSTLLLPSSMRLSKTSQLKRLQTKLSTTLKMNSELIYLRSALSLTLRMNPLCKKLLKKLQNLFRKSLPAPGLPAGSVTLRVIKTKARIEKAGETEVIKLITRVNKINNWNVNDSSTNFLISKPSNWFKANLFYSSVKAIFEFWEIFIY